MDLLRNLFGSVTSGFIRLAVGVGVIAAVGIFIVKPTLDTVDKGFKYGESLENVGVENTLKNSGVDVNAINRTIKKANRQVQITITKSFHVAKHQGTADVKKLGRCMQRALGDINRVQRCAARYG